jgi:hypothetical protein
MKNRIATLEGETRTSKGLRTSLERHVKLLEIALKKEREKVRGLNKGEPVDTQKEPRDLARGELRAVGKGKKSFPEVPTTTDTRQNQHRRVSAILTRILTLKTILPKVYDRRRNVTSRKATSPNVPLRSPIMFCPRIMCHQKLTTLRLRTMRVLSFKDGNLPNKSCKRRIFSYNK